jgi:hypothetical protein
MLSHNYLLPSLLGLREGSKLGFWKNLIGQGEKWQILKASASQLASIAGGAGVGVGGGGFSNGNATSFGAGGGGSRGVEDVESRGSFVRLGDAILLQTSKSDHLLSLHDAVQGPEARVVYRDRAGLGAEVWQLEQVNVVALPAWYKNRPYLRCKVIRCEITF